MRHLEEKNSLSELQHTAIIGCLKALSAGELILFPTDTLWGIGCDATNDKAVEKIYQLKRREENKSLVILVNGDEMLSKYVDEIPDAAKDLLEYAENPLTIVYPSASGISGLAIANDKSVAVRVTKDPFCCELIRKFRKPVVATSANMSGDPSPNSFLEINPAILKGVAYVVNLHEHKRKLSTPSTIIKVDKNNVIKFVRK